mgnify:CR=1 FL=1
MKMKSVYCYMLAGLMLSASSCSSWLSEDDAPVMSYDYYETEALSLIHISEPTRPY